MLEKPRSWLVWIRSSYFSLFKTGSPTFVVIVDSSSDAANPDATQRRQFLSNKLDLLDTYDEDILPLLLVVYQGTMVSQV